MKHLFLIVLAFMACLVSSAQPQAKFSALESSSTYYYQGWDTDEEINSWSYSPSNSGKFTWYLAENPTYSGQPPFSSIDENSKYSLGVNYSSSSYQNELCSSPILDIHPNSMLEFYACFKSVYLVYADWELYIYDTEADKIEKILSGFQWSQDHEFTGPLWQRFSIDLDSYAGKKCTFSFRYNGPNGEDLFIDGFKLVEKNENEDAVVEIYEEGKVHFQDQSTGNPTSWEWTFEGGNPVTSSEQHPTVTYPDAGTYSVTLKASNRSGSSTYTRQQYVIVKQQAPHAYIGLPDMPYYSPWAALFIPKGGTIAYQDQSRGKPTSWSWTFQGGEPATSSEQNPSVTYAEEGVYGMTLDVSNGAGSSSDFMKNAIQVGGSQYAWNIAVEEQSLLGTITMGFYGYYGGTNWLGMLKYAEHFDKPAVAVEIDSVQVLFDKTTAIDETTPITVSICLPDVDGMPGEVIASSTLPASELVYDQDYYMPTKFKLDKKVTVDSEFFVVIEGMTNNEKDNPYAKDDMSVLSVRRDEGGKSTVYHYLEDEDPLSHKPLGTYKWYKQDEAVSLAIIPRLTYLSEVDGIQPATEVQKPTITNRYSVNGQQVGPAYRGIQILKMSNGKARKVVR